MILDIDFETASDLDLTDVGVYHYVEDPSTFIRCMCWSIDGGPVQTWVPDETFPDELKEAVQRGQVHAWNAQFERVVWQALMPKSLPQPSFNQWRCTAALARINGLPGALDDCARVLALDLQKLKFQKHWADVAPLSYSDTVGLITYCRNDVKVERLIETKLTPWTDDELFIYQINERINDLGVMIDVNFCLAMNAYLSHATAALNVELCKITSGMVEKFTQVERIKDYIFRAMAWRPDSLDKPAITTLLRLDTLPPAVRRVLQIRRDGALSSTSKYGSLLQRMSRDHRVRGMFMFAGAGQTGRFSSVGAQLHNLVRAVPKDHESLIKRVKHLSLEQFQRLDERPIIKLASQLIRPALIAPPGKLFVIGDYSAVEAKAVPWLARNADEVALWATGVDLYPIDARNALNIDPAIAVTDEQRNVGKVVRLACGFGGKKGAVLAMAESYGIDMTEATAHRIAQRWHDANPWVEAFGQLLETAAKHAVANPGSEHYASRIMYYCETFHGVRVLRCRLPSGRVISYHDVRVEAARGGGYQLSSIKPRETTREHLWHGIFAENTASGMCNDLLRYSMVLLWSEGFRLVAHVHDEHVAEVDAARPRVELFTQLIETRPPWALDFPLTAKVVTATRYAK